MGFHALTKTIDTTTSAGRFLFEILVPLAAFERDVVCERTRRPSHGAGTR